MATVTVNFSSLTEIELRRVLVAHNNEHQHADQPQSVQTSYAAEHNGGRVGCIVRVAGSGYEVTTMPLLTDSGARVIQEIA